jgi:hypothetical protein
MNFKNMNCNDVDGNILNLGDKVVVLDAEDLEGIAPKRGELLIVTKCIDAESNYIEFDSKYAFYGHRILRVYRLTDEV